MRRPHTRHEGGEGGHLDFFMDNFNFGVYLLRFMLSSCSSQRQRQKHAIRAGVVGFLRADQQLIKQEKKEMCVL